MDFDKMQKLHLGCGGVYLDGYINIDFPLEQQTETVFSNAKVDKYADIVTLQYCPSSVSEVRLHHVFEHFDRPTALGLLVNWYQWLCEGGVITIETPDFARCAKAYLLGGEKKRGIILRHLFGSHDAHWAVHYDGWYKKKFREYLSALGYHNINIRQVNDRGLFNITVRAQKKSPYLTLMQQKTAAEKMLRLSLVDNSPSEQRRLGVWLKTFDAILNE